MSKKKQVHTKSKMERIAAIILLVAMVASFIASCLLYF